MDPCLSLDYWAQKKDLTIEIVPEQGLVGPNSGVEIADIVEESKIVIDLEDDGRNGADEGA